MLAGDKGAGRPLRRDCEFSPGRRDIPAVTECSHSRPRYWLSTARGGKRAARPGTVRVKHATVLIGGGLLMLAGAGNQGCRWGERRAGVEEVPLIDGISVLEYDGLDLRVKRAASGAAGLFLVVNGRLVDEAALRVGDGFVITDGRSVHRAYHLLAATDDRITLKRQAVFDDRATREGIRTVDTVIAVRPYNREATD